MKNIEEKNYEKVLELPVPMPVVKTGSAEPEPEASDVVIDLFNDDDLDCFIIQPRSVTET